MIVKVYEADRKKLVERFGDKYENLEALECNWIVASSHDIPYDFENYHYASGIFRFPKLCGYILTPHKVYEVKPNCFYKDEFGIDKVSTKKCVVKNKNDIDLSKIKDEEKRELMRIFLKNVRFKKKGEKKVDIE